MFTSMSKKCFRDEEGEEGEGEGEGERRGEEDEDEEDEEDNNEDNNRDDMPSFDFSQSLMPRWDNQLYDQQSWQQVPPTGSGTQDAPQLYDMLTPTFPTYPPGHEPNLPPIASGSSSYIPPPRPSVISLNDMPEDFTHSPRLSQFNLSPLTSAPVSPALSLSNWPTTQHDSSSPAMWTSRYSSPLGSGQSSPAASMQPSPLGSTQPSPVESAQPSPRGPMQPSLPVRFLLALISTDRILIY